MCVFCNVWVGVCLGFLIFGCVYVWFLLFVNVCGGICGICNVWVCLYVFDMCVFCMCVF